MKTKTIRLWMVTLEKEDDISGDNLFHVASDTPEETLALLYAELGAVKVKRIELCPAIVIVKDIE